MKIFSPIREAMICVVSLVLLNACSKQTPASSAQQSPTPSGGFVSQAQARADRIKSELALTDGQIQKFQAIMDEGRTARQALRSDQSLTDEQRRAKMQEMRQVADAKIEAILTPDQLTKWNDMQAKREAGRGNWQNRGDHGAGEQQSPAPAAQ